jgi:hypothetical protein
MSKTALIQLQEQVEAIRREAFAQGYAAAMKEVGEFATRPGGTVEKAAAGKRPRRPVAAKAAPVRKPRAAQTAAKTARAAASGRPQRGTNARLVAEVLQAIAPRAARPAEIRNTLRRDKGVAMAFTSIRHALGQLEGRHAVEQVADGKMWRHLTGESAAAHMSA